MADDLNILIVESTTEATSWLLVSGASYHVTPFRSQFRQYMAQSFDTVHVGNSQHYAVVGIGTVELNLPGGSTIVLHDVRHVPELTRPLISEGQLDEPGIRASFSSGGWSLHKGNLLLAHSPKILSLYPFDVTLREGDLFVVDILVSSLWHERLGHPNKAGITHLSKAGYIPKLSFSDHQFCENCQYRKQVPMPHQSLGGASYFVTFIDDAT
jgi:hypothetical protein